MFTEQTMMALEYWANQTMVLAYRWSEYALLNLADDPAILAFIFC